MRLPDGHRPLNCSTQNSDEMTIGKSRPSLLVFKLRVESQLFNLDQDISTSDEAALESLIENNPSLIKQIHQYFNTGPQVILLPVLQWNYEQMPDFNEEGFYLDYDHIEAAHPPLRDRMLYGLNKIAFFINTGVSDEESYFINCENFENLIENVYNSKLQ